MGGRRGGAVTCLMADAGERLRAGAGYVLLSLFFFQAEDGIRDLTVTGVQTCALPISQIFVGLALSQGRTEKDAVVHSLRAADFAVTDMTDDEMAKLHVRYMVGGHARGKIGRASCRERV